jgi:hypothetical protein
MFFVQYMLVLVQRLDEGEVTVSTFDLESGITEGSLKIPCQSTASLMIEPGNECFYFVTGSEIGKIEVPALQESFRVSTGHAEPICDLSLSSLGQLITT